MGGAEYARVRGGGAVTLLRIFERNHHVANVIVDDWQDRDGRATFTLPADHPRADYLFDKAIGTEVSILVMGTNEVEWMLESAHRGLRWSYCKIELKSRRRKLFETQPNDEWCIRMFGVEQ